MEFKDRLKTLRNSLNLTQQEVADALGIDRCAYSFYEIGKTMPKIETLKAMSRLFNTNVDFLICNFSQNNEEILCSPNDFGCPNFEDKFNDLSDFEKAVVFKTRLMSAKEKNELMKYLSANKK